MIVIFVEFIDQLIDYPIIRASLSIFYVGHRIFFSDSPYSLRGLGALNWFSASFTKEATFVI